MYNPSVQISWNLWSTSRQNSNYTRNRHRWP